eukprot:gene23584-9112_t
MPGLRKGYHRRTPEVREEERESKRFTRKRISPGSEKNRRISGAGESAGAFYFRGLVTVALLACFYLAWRGGTGSDFTSVELEEDRQHQMTLKFEVCNGMSNQRLSVVYGIILASELGRVPVIPGVILSGVQWSSKATEAVDKSVHMEELYDVEYFKYTLDSVGIEVLDSRDAPPNTSCTYVDISKLQGDVVEGLAVHRSVNHLSIGCPLFRLDGLYFEGNNDHILWATLNGMRPNTHLDKIVSAITKKLKSESPDNRFNFVHLRIEDDWVLHCIRWSHIRDGHIRNNCNNNSDTIDEVLRSLNVKITDPVYIASYWDHVDELTEQVIMNRMAAAGYKVFTSRDFKMHFENPKWDYMVKAAVRSATRHHSIKPFCVFFGNMSSPIFHWLADNGVTFIFHRPTWAEDLWGKAQINKHRSHLNLSEEESIYSSFSSLQNDFIRMDLPVLPELEQFIYVLYTQPDVFFQKKVTLSSFSIPLPEVIGMVTDPSSPSGVDGSVSLINLPAARKSYTLFKDFVLSHPDCPRFDKGPGVVGAYLEFYGDSVTKDLLDKKFAAKPTDPINPAAAVVHFYGPKPHEYWDYIQSGVCPGHMDSTFCPRGLDNSLCNYMKIWHGLAVEVDGDSQDARLEDIVLTWITMATCLTSAGHNTVRSPLPRRRRHMSFHMVVHE